MLACLMSLLPLVEPGVPVEPLAHVTHERAALSTAHYAMPAHVFREYRPTARVTAPGGNLADEGTLARVLPAAAASGEVMLLCIGGEGASRTGLNLVLNFRDMGLHNMLILTPARPVCARLWEVTPELACVWWPAAFKRRRPPSLYNTKFNPTALAFFEARKILLEKLVIRHHLNVLHLDADSLWFANPMPLFKTVRAETSQRPRSRDKSGTAHAPLTPPCTTRQEFEHHALIFQTDGPFVNAGIFYVQRARDGDAAAWVLAELNRRIERFTYRPESVAALPHSSWASAPFFANADEQANLNDVITSALVGKQSYAAGVEFAEAPRTPPLSPSRPATRTAMSGGRLIMRPFRSDLVRD